MADRPSPASRSAHALIDRLVADGTEHVVVCPGSRSQALALAAAAAAAERGAVTLHVRVDERSAGFLALGLARGSRKPVAVVTTSGTAVANLHPAMLEAWHSGDPLIALTADRPAEVRGTGSNQTTRQPGIFGPAVVWELDVEAPIDEPGLEVAAAGLADEAYARAAGEADGQPGPVHLNLAYREPLSGSVLSPETDPLPARRIEVREPVSGALARGPRTLVIAGTGAGPEAEAVARAGGWPLVAEVTSGARFGPQLVPAYRTVLTDGPADAVERVLIFGRPNLSREVPRLLARRDIELILVGVHGAEPVDPHGTATRVDSVTVDGQPSPDELAWARQWIGMGRAAALAAEEPEPSYRGGGATLTPAEQSKLMRAELAATRAPVTRRALVEAIWKATWPHDRLWFAASRLVREADGVVPGKKVPVFANRGLAGIDGTVSAAIGLAASSRSEKSSTGTTRVLIGDLALLHDVGGLYVPGDEPRPRVQVVVGNDGGGTIFDGLEVGATAAREAFERVMITPQHVDIASLAVAYGWEHQTVSTRGDLDRALTSPPAGLSILEVPLTR